MGGHGLKYLLDTHVWIWWNMNPSRLSVTVLDLISNPGGYDELLLSAISPWEFSKLLEKKRLGISMDPAQWIDEALKMPKLRLVPLTPRIAFQSTRLPGVFHDDPADQIIVAAARFENAVLLTKDERIRKYKHVKTVW
ncbi:MAG: type II toxin-antitoxin system VapC family toxin [Spirochaetota bacterium]|nr:type II toxin-antitoxin system VapC family toxin [Spirochaetota bacterium]